MDDCPKTEQSPARSVDSPKQPLAERKPEPFISTARTTGSGFWRAHVLFFGRMAAFTKLLRRSPILPSKSPMHSSGDSHLPLSGLCSIHSHVVSARLSARGVRLLS